MSHDNSASPVAEGDIIAGKYRVARTLGVGGMGVVVAAVHMDLNQRVALKFLLPQAARHPELVERFAREARAAAQIHSEHVARVIDIGTLDTGSPYMVMEYLDGEDLAHALETSGGLPIETAVGHVLQACEAIAEAHVIGIVHRDLKPANLFLARRPNGSTIVKVLDFGISKSTVTSSDTGLTHGATMMGSPSYMSPEQIRSAKSVDMRADQWSLGIILYELISGVKPFKGEAIAQLVWQITDSPHDPLSMHVPRVPRALEAAIDRCLAKNPADRFADVAELAVHIAPFGPEWSTASTHRTSHVLGAAAANQAIALPARVRSPSFPVLPEASRTPPPIRLPVTGGLAMGMASDVRPSFGGGDHAPSTVPDPPDEGGIAEVDDPTVAAPVAGGDPAMTGAPWSQSFPGTPVAAPTANARPRLIMPAVIGAGSAFALVAAIVLVQMFARTEGTSVRPSIAADPAVAPSLSAVAAVAPPQTSGPPASAPLPSAERALPTIASATPAEAPPTASLPISIGESPSSVRPQDTPHAATRPHPPATGTAKPLPSSAPRCSTVSYFDGDGMKHFKQVCQ